jgi:hypothetical protein
MPYSAYSVIQIEPEWVLETEALGSKEKFWFRRKDDEPEWLFKFPEPNTGQHWAEKIAAEVAASLDILHARVELAVFQGTRGSTAESFAREGRELFHGNQILAGKVLGYNPNKRFQQSDHTLTNIFAAIDRTFPAPAASKTKTRFAEYLVLDALIGNTDRHHENWGILRKRAGNRWQGMLAPTFDHASSLGRELLDIAQGKCRERLLRERRVEQYAENARGGIYWETTDKRGLSPLELVRRAATLYPELFKPPLARQKQLDRRQVEAIINRVPIEWMTPLQREFALELMCYNRKELEKI